MSTFDRRDRGINGIVCFGCRGHGYLRAVHVATGTERRAPCLDCEGTGFVRHCIACQGVGMLDMGEGLETCPECEGKGYPKPKRQYFYLGAPA